MSCKSGQKVNSLKSKVMFSQNCHQDKKETLANCLEIKARKSLGKYQGFPIFHNRPTYRDFQFIINNMRTKLDSWKTQFLYISRRTTLAKASLGSIPSMPCNTSSYQLRCAIKLIESRGISFGVPQSLRGKFILWDGRLSPGLRRKEV